MKKKKMTALLMSISMLMSGVGITGYAQKEENRQSQPQYEEHPVSTQSPETESVFGQMFTEQQTLESAYEANASEGETAALFADTAVVSGTISLPSGVTAKENGRIGIYFYEFEKDGNRIVNLNNSAAVSTYVSIKKGDSEVSYSVSVPKGNYVAAVRYYMGEADVVNTMLYYSADGMCYRNEMADELNITAN